VSITEERSETVDQVARVGLLMYGVVHLVTAWLALQLALGDQSTSASQKGAMPALADTPFGRGVLYVVAAGLACLVVWQAIEALAGHRDADGAMRFWKRLESAGFGVVYGVLAGSALKTALGGNGGGGTRSVTERLMSAPAGQLLVVASGLAVVGVGGYLCYRGWTEGFRREMSGEGTTGTEGRAYLLLGKVGFVAKGMAFAAVGALFVWAGLSHNAKHSGGLDKALHDIVRQPLGPVLLGAIAVGIGCYGLFCFAWAWHLDR